MAEADRTLTKKGASTRDRIVDAARTMLLERGYDGLVLRELADSLDITLGNLQYYFATREALALHVLQLEGTHDARLIEDRLLVDGPLDTFRFIVRDMAMRYRGESGRLLLMITSLAQHHAAFEQLYRGAYAGFYPVFEELLAELRPELAPAELTARARVVNALVEGSAFQVDVGDVDAYLDRILAECEAIALR